MATLQTQTRIGGYELIRLLGEGGMGEVWLAQDKLAERPVALKFIKPHLLSDPGFRTRFSNEAKTLGKLEHDRIVTLYTVLDEGAHLALVLRFIDGKSLADRIDTQGAIPINFVLSCARDILPALQFAHDNGIIHRDIKPENILVDGRDRCFLMDFGIAVAAFAERGTVTGFAIGTPHYMSPEQIRTPRQIGHQSDIYSFGVVLYEMLSGRVPFGVHSGVEDIYAIQHAHCNEAPPSLAGLNPQLPAAVDEVVMACLEKDPANRPQSCDELLHQLEAASQNSAPARRSYAATVVEPHGGTSDARSTMPMKPLSSPVPAGPAAGTLGVPISSPAPHTAAARRKIPQKAWYAVGALFVAGAIGYAVLNSSSKPTGSRVEHTPIPPITDTVTPPEPPVLDKGRSKTPVAGGSQTPIASGGKPGQTNNTNNILILQQGQNAQHPGTNSLQSTPPAVPTAQQAEAQRDFESGQRLFNDGNYCESKAKLDDAVSLFPNPKYTKLQRSAANGCNSQ